MRSNLEDNPVLFCTCSTSRSVIATIPKLTEILSARTIRRCRTHCPNSPEGLGRVDGFDDDDAKSKCDEGSEVLVRFLAAERNSLEALELTHKLLDAGAGAIERLREERRPVLGR